MDHLLSATDIMVKQVIKLSPEDGVLEGIRRLLEDHITGAPVIDASDEYLGVFSEKCAIDVLVQATRALAGREHSPSVRAADLMQTDILRLQPDQNAFDAIELLLIHRVSGAPVVDDSGAFVGSFSEKTAMSVLLGAAYDRLPDPSVGAFMDVDLGRTIRDRETDLLSIAEVFLRTPYRRLVVLEEGRVAGLIGRKDVLRTAARIQSDSPDDFETLADRRRYSVGAAMDREAETISGDLDIFRISTIFQRTPYRRLPVLDGRSLLGIVSRRDVLAGVLNTLGLAAESDKGAAPLYLSALANEPPPHVKS